MTDNLPFFVDVIAYGTLVFSALYSAFTAYGEHVYRSPESVLRPMDTLQGIRREYPWFRRAIPGLVALAWIISRALS